ncbi:DUF885 domain-containing protein [Myxococcota bacterium]|nr:DUF885 domain-containing protein [Myxococcota bacterium]
MTLPSTDAFALSDALVERVAALRPTMATFMGVRGHDTAWDDFSPDGLSRQAALLTEVDAALAALPPAPDAWHGLAAATLADFTSLERERLESGDAYHDLNGLASSFQVLRMVFDVMDASTPEGAAAVEARLTGLPVALESYRRLLSHGLETGEIVAARQVRLVIDQARLAAAPDGFFTGLAARLDTPGAAAGAAATRAAYVAFADWLEGAYLPQARTHDAVGPERYARAARRMLGAIIDPVETYAWGWTEVRTILAEMTRLAASIRPGATLTETLAWLRDGSDLRAPDLEGFLAFIRERQTQALAALVDTSFDVPEPVRHVEVRHAPETGVRGAYYMQPSEDFSRPGGIWYARDAAGSAPLFDEVSTAYHEGFPGHHLQIGLQIAQTAHLSRWQRLGDGFSGYAEGWALYAEQLMLELGFYERPEYVLGMYANQLMRALRVVIDIGLHLELPIPADAPFEAGEPWTFDRAVHVLNTFGGMDVTHAESDVNRYLGWPGQAISYKVGQRVFLALREHWRALQGDTPASLRAFHTTVLGCGNVGLDRLEAIVRAAATQQP